MKKLLLIITFLVMTIVAKAQVMYFISSGHSPEENNISVYIVVKDNSGQLWNTMVYINTLKKNLLANRNYYVDAFNTGTHTIPATYLPFIGTQSSPARYDENTIVSKHDTNLRFGRLIILQRTQKSIVCKTSTVNDWDISFKYAFSLDFKTMVQEPDEVNPSYYTSIPVDKFIVRRSIDDLF